LDIRSLNEIWPSGHAPFSIHWIIRAVQMLGKGAISSGLRIAWNNTAELSLALGEQASTQSSRA
jgi:hypothetical protein